MAGGGEDTGHFAQGGGPGFHVAEAECDGDGLEGGVGEGEMEGVGEDGAMKAFLAGTREHGLAEIGAGDDGARGGALDGEGEIAAAGGEIEEGGGLPGADQGGGACAPEEVEAAGEEMVCEVVPSRDGREEGVDEVWLLQKRAGYLRGQMTRIKQKRLIPVRIERVIRKF